MRSHGFKWLALVGCLIVAILLWLAISHEPTSSFRATSIAACAGHTVVLHQDRNIWGWLNNTLDIENSPRFAIRPSKTRGGTNWIAMATGWQTVAGVKEDGSLWASGNGAESLWGDKTLQLTTTPAQVGTNTDWRSVAAGNDFFAALKGDGTLWAWGGNRHGQLGDGTGNVKEWETTGKKLPVQIGQDTNWVMVAARVFRATALKSDGSLWAWGWNIYGELGDGSYQPRNKPVRIGKEDDWAAVFVGNAHTLGIKRTGSLWSWGENREGQLGDGTQTKKSYPIRVGNDQDWLMAAGGRDHTLAIKKDGSLWAWGLNADAQLGDGTRISRLTPVRIGWSKDWVAITAGEFHSVGLKRDGSIYAWGDVRPPKERALLIWARRNLARIGVKLPPKQRGVVTPTKVTETMPDPPAPQRPNASSGL